MKSDLPIFFLILVFAGLLFAIYHIKPYQAPVSIVPVVNEKQWNAFTGRMVMPSVDDFYVLENSADRDLFQFEKFLQGRAAGLHWASAEHFMKLKNAAPSEKKDVVIGLKLTLDSLGMFTPEILFSNTDDENLKGLVLSQIQTYWRYPRSVGGRFVVWVPIVWKANY